MFIHVSFNVLAVAYNTVIVAKSHVLSFLLYFSHNLAHFQKFIEALLDS